MSIGIIRYPGSNCDYDALNYFDTSFFIWHKETTMPSMIDLLIIPGGFDKRGVEGKIKAAQYAREKKRPFLGIWGGMQVAVIEFARHIAGLNDANSSEFDKNTPNPVIGLITEWLDEAGQVNLRDESSDLGGTMRLGAQKAILTKNSLASKAYDVTHVLERHRHLYEVNNHYVETLVKNGLMVGARSANDELVEMIELPDHPWFLGCQFHPEYNYPNPIFKHFLNKIDLK